MFWGDSCDENGVAISHNHKQPPADSTVPKNTVLSINAEQHIVPAITDTLSGDNNMVSETEKVTSSSTEAELSLHLTLWRYLKIGEMASFDPGCSYENPVTAMSVHW